MRLRAVNYTYRDACYVCGTAVRPPSDPCHPDVVTLEVDAGPRMWMLDLCKPCAAVAGPLLARMLQDDEDLVQQLVER